MAPKKQQTRLTLEPVGPRARAQAGTGTGAGASGLPEQLPPANIRYATGKGAGASSSQSRASPSQQASRKSSRSGKVQSRLQTSTGPLQDSKSSSRNPVAGSTKKSKASKNYIASDSDDSVPGAINISSEDEDDEKDVPTTSLSYRPPIAGTVKRRRDAVISSDDEDDIPVRSSQANSHARALKRHRSVMPMHDEDSSDDDGPIVPPSSSRRRRQQVIELEDSSEEDAPPAKSTVATPGRLRSSATQQSSPTRRSTGHRTKKQKTMQLLRRRRAGEKIHKLTSSEEESGEEKRGLYDSDPEQQFQVLKEFDDEESDEVPAQQSSRKSRQPEEQSGNGSANQGGGNNEDDLDDFIVEDDDAPLGAPADVAIPLEFTAQAHRPLEVQFPLVVEWLVHNRINPAFERNDPVYTNAWRKLDDEVSTLASSKFTSSAWKSEFRRVVNGRPKLVVYELDHDERNNHSHLNCEACGRSGHPVSYLFTFSGHPYHKNTLADVESDSDNSDDESVDEQGAGLPSVDRAWYVGARCGQNAEIAHGLVHWKHELKDWVEEHLEMDGWMAAPKLKERERMKARKRRQLANDIVDGWRKGKIVDQLYANHMKKLEDARNKKPDTGRGYTSRRR
ncbi:hypothetical protein GGS26DRAFT_502556 [Hypomontagnella submonticulosa]|nr:hypothetical protein GGS26DRAFT_502556 [Hypomontagnella submonticulosa]